MLVPNPARGQSELRVTATQREWVQVRVLSAVGVEVFRKGWQVEAGQQVMALPLSDLAAGTYFVDLQLNDSHQLLRLLVID